MAYTFEYILVEYQGPSASGKTGVWQVYNRSSDAYLGRVKWYGPWRQYAFYPGSDTVWSAGCMRDLATFCEQATDEHRRQTRSLDAGAEPVLESGDEDPV